jgi:hypothetical protein
VGRSLQTDLRGLVLRSEYAMESTMYDGHWMMDTGHVGAASDHMAEVTQRIATIVTYAQAARQFLDHRPPDLDEVRQALDCIVRDGYRACDVIYRIRGLRTLQGGAAER